MKRLGKNLLLLAATLPGLPTSVYAADKYMSAGAGGAVWDATASNWGVVPQGPYNTAAWVTWDFAHFVGTGGTVTLSGNQFANYVYFDADGYTLSGSGTLTIGNPGNQRIDVTAPGATATINATVNSTYNNTNFYEGTGTLILSGTGNQFKGMTVQSGTLRLTQAVSNSAATTINGGTLSLTGAGGLGASAVTVNAGGIFDLSSTGAGSGAVTVNAGGILTGTGVTTGNIALGAGSGILLNASGSVQGATVTFGAGTNIFVNEAPAGAVTRDVIRYTGTTPGTANLTAASNYRNASYTDASNKISLTYTAVNNTWNSTTGGAWQVGGGDALWSNTSDTNFAWGDAVTFGGSATQTVTLSGNLAPASVLVDNSAGTYTFSGSGSIVGAGRLTKSGAGSLILSNANTYSGGTTITGGVLQVGAGGTAGTLGTGRITLSSGATLDFERSDTIDLTSAYSFAPNSAGAILMNAGAGTIGVRTNITADTLTATSTATGSSKNLYGSAYGAAINVFGQGGACNITTTGNQTYAGLVSIGSTVANQTTTLRTTNGGSISLASGVISGRSTYWSAATLNLDTSAGTGDVTLGGATASYGVANLNVSTGTGLTTLTGGSYNYDYSVFNNGVKLTGDSSFIKGNAWVRGVTFRGDVTGTGKTLTVTLGNGAANTEGVGTGGLIFNTTTTQTVSANIAGGALLNKSGSGVTTLSGTNTYTGGTTVAAGTLQVGNGGTTGSLGNGGTVTVASGATLAYNLGSAYTASALSVAGNLAYTSAAQLGLSGTYGANQITATGANVSVNGTMTINAGAGGATITGTSSTAAGITSGGGRNITTTGNVTFTGTTTAGGYIDGISLAGAYTATSGTLTFDGTAGSGGAYGIENGVSGSWAPGIGGPSISTFGNVVFKGAGGATRNSDLNLGDISGNGTVTLVGRAKGLNRGVTFTATGGQAYNVVIQTINGAGINGLFGAGTDTTGNGDYTVDSAGAVAFNGRTIDAGTGTISLTAGGAYAIDGNTTLRAASLLINDTRVFTVASGRALTIDASGVISNAIGGAGAFVKTGTTSTLTLAGNNGYSGGATISAGTLVTGNISALGAGAVTVAGGTLQIGDANVNTVTGVGTITLTSGALKFVAANASITQAAGASFALSDGFVLDLNNAFNVAGDYWLITSTGTGNSIGAYTLNNADTANFNYAFTLSGTGGLLSVTAVPEPGAYGLLGAGALAALAVVRRRRKRV